LAYFDTTTSAMSASVGMPPSIRRRGAGVFGTAGDDHAKDRRDFVEAFGSLFADHRHGLAAAGAHRAFRLDDLLDPVQMRRQRAPVRAAFLRPLAFQAFVFLFVFGVGFGAGGLKLFQNQSELLFAQPLGFAAEARPPQDSDDVMKLLVGGVEGVAFRRQPIALFSEKPFRSPLGKNQRAQGVDIVGKRVGGSSDHDGSLADLRSIFS
jgi:hypothetical protein